VLGQPGGRLLVALTGPDKVGEKRVLPALYRAAVVARIAILGGRGRGRVLGARAGALLVAAGARGPRALGFVGGADLGVPGRDPRGA